MHTWNALVDRVAAIPLVEDSIRALLHEIAAKLDEFDFYEETIDADTAQQISDNLADMAYALRAKTEDLIDAIVRKPRPEVIPLPDQSRLGESPETR